jgi:hypothetical protein
VLAAVFFEQTGFLIGLGLIVLKDGLIEGLEMDFKIA